MNKVCTTCKETKPLTEFYKNSKGLFGKAQKCKCCTKKWQSVYYKNFHSKVYARKYNTTELHISEILQVSVCQICNSPPTENKRLNIDHDHTSGSIRGMLCDNCNTGIGKFKDDPNLLDKASRYLKEFYGNKNST